MRFSPHGDASILGTAVRMSQDFSLRYPVIEVQGNNGSLMNGDDYSQARYIEMRGNEIAWDMTNLLAKDTVDEWKLNYTEEEEYPTVLPSKFPFALVNGSYGIAVACSSSLPPHNIVDVCKAIITLINNPDATFEELYCPIDFPTGGIIINEEAVKESLKNGNGKAALIRATIDYDENENELIVKEIPYMTFTNTIVKSISKAIDDGLIYGISSVIDGTDYEGCKIYIKLEKNVNVQKIVKLLYKHTLLQNSFSINMNMLENGKVPRLYTWKEMLETYVAFLKEIIVKSYNFDLNKLLNRINILNGLIMACENIEEVVKTIRAAESIAAAKTSLIEKFGFNDTQTDAILKLKLSSLTHLEISKLQDEKDTKEKEAERIKLILSSEENIKKEMINDVTEIQNKYGDAHRTKVINLDFSSEDDDAEPIEKKELIIHYTNLGNLYAQESTTLLRTHRGGKGSKIKLASNEVVLQTINDDNLNSLLIFTNLGNMHSIQISDLPVGSKININQLCNLESNEKPTAITSCEKTLPEYFVFITKNGMIKKTKSSEYSMRKGKSLKAINLKDNDEVINVLFCDNQDVGILTSAGNYVRISTEDINPIGRTAMGIKAIKLKPDNKVICAHLIESIDKYLLTISEKGMIKKTSLNDFPVNNRPIIGKQVSEVKENDKIIKCLTLEEDCDIIIIVQKKSIKISTSEIPTQSRAAIGVKAVNITDADIVSDMIRSQE